MSGWRRLLALLLVLVAACATPRSRIPYDPGRRVHFVVHVRPAAPAPTVVAPVCTVGTYTLRAPATTIPPGGAAVEIGFLDVATGEYRVSMYDPGSGAHASASARVAHEMWAVLQFDPATGRGRIGLFTEPPHEEIGAIAALPKDPR
jgi:hypothetical protein